MIKKILFFSSLFVLSLFCFLVATAPANLLWKKVLEPQVKNQVIGLKVYSVQGTVWDGKAQASYNQLPFIIEWGISLRGILSLKVPVSLALQSQAGTMQLLAEPGLNNSYLTLEKANIDLSQLTPLVKRRRVVLDGQLVVKDLRFTFRDQKLASLSGLASWSGGEVAYPAGRQIHERNLPAFRAKAATAEDGVIHIGIRDAEASFDIIDATIGAQGEAILKVARRLLDISDEAWPKNSKETDIVFKVKKVIY